MSDLDTIVELRIAEDIKEIVAKEIDIIKSKDKRDASDIMKLEKLSKTYANMMADLRENIKSGLYGKLSKESLDGVDQQIIRSKNSPKAPKNPK